MNELTIEHLSAYLPYGLKGRFYGIVNDYQIKLSLNSYSSANEFGYDIALFLKSKVKPILFPIESIKEEIEIGGEKFVPMEVLTEDTKPYDKTLIELQCVVPETLPYFYFNQLCIWKIDVFGLIPAGLAIPVTEEFNPYK